MKSNIEHKNDLKIKLVMIKKNYIHNSKFKAQYKRKLNATIDL